MLEALTKLTQMTQSMQHAHLAPWCWACASLIDGLKTCTSKLGLSNVHGQAHDAMLLEEIDKAVVQGVMRPQQKKCAQPLLGTASPQCTHVPVRCMTSCCSKADRSGPTILCWGHPGSHHALMLQQALLQVGRQL